MANPRNATLGRIYHNPKSPGSLGGVDRLFREARKQFPDITRADVTKWLAGKDIYSLHKSVRWKFKRNRYYVSRPDELWQMDLADMSAHKTKNKGYAYFLTVIDVFSKFLWTVPIKNKRPATIQAALESILTKERKPKKLMSDKGGEFTGRLMKGLYKKYDITYFTSQNEDVKCAVVERVIRTIKDRIYRKFTATSKERWLEILPQITFSYNHSYHRTIKMRPSDVTYDNTKQVFRNTYGVDSFLDFLYILPSPKKKVTVGDFVRLRKHPTVFNKGYQQKWTTEKYEVIGKNRYTEPLYRIKDYVTPEPIIGRFYEQEIQRIPNVDGRKK